MNISEESDQKTERAEANPNIDVGKAIATLRQNLLLSISEFSMRTGYSRVHLSRVEAGERKVTQEMIKTIRKVFHLDTSWPELANFPSKDNDMGPSVSDLKTLSSIGATKERLLALRKELNLNQKEFAKLTGISVANIEAVEFERRKLTMRMAKRIEDACGIGTEWLLHGDEDAKYHPCGQRMTSFLKKHPEARRKVWEMMECEND
ncbi:MAG: helix-turn-helix domain-containing protein [Sphaerochaeta sp.]|uniref:helix-turn-helix domain-containing protein n=1 Tax=Sphaerochaeta sp. TaxID=1972642 RepID=UPI003D0ACF7C